MEEELYKKILFKVTAQVKDNRVNNKEDLKNLENQYIAIKANQDAVINNAINRA